MLDFITKSVSKLFGTKSDRDLKDIQPILDSVLEAFPKLGNLSNDQLREKTAEFKKRIFIILAISLYNWSICTEKSRNNYSQFY